MNKKVIVGGAATMLASIVIHKSLRSQNGQAEPKEIWTAADMPDLTSKVIIVTFILGVVTLLLGFSDLDTIPLLVVILLLLTPVLYGLIVWLTVPGEEEITIT